MIPLKRLLPAGAFGLLLAFLLDPPGAARAQFVSSFGVAASFEPPAYISAVPAVRLGPTLSLDTRQARVGLEAGATTLGGITRYESARLAGRLLLGTRGCFAPELVVRAAHRSEVRGMTTATMRPEVRLNVAGVYTGVWVASAAEGVFGDLNEQRRVSRLPLLGFGAWARRHHVTVAGALEQNVGLLPGPVVQPQPDTGYVVRDALPGRSTQATDQVTLTTAHAAVRWDGDRVEFESVAGVTLSPLSGPRRWGQASLAYRLSPQLAVVASAGSRSPELFAIDPAGAPRASLALRLSEWRSALPGVPLPARAQARECVVRSLGGGRHAIAIRAPGARIVEITGDMTDWNPVTLEPVSGERWEVVLEIAPGVHQLTLRLDGGPWSPPPGAPTMTDGYNGTVGVIVVE